MLRRWRGFLNKGGSGEPYGETEGNDGFREIEQVICIYSYILLIFN